MIARHAKYGDVEFPVNTDFCGCCGEMPHTHGHKDGCEMAKTELSILLDKTTHWSDVLVRYKCDAVEGVPV